ncbi:ABC-type sugar transport system, periplasmic component [Opitutaceae bacterium TAV1]|nr:ABC-type sugar transport system, periplasmic component [Opitutaceae bacterium TAV1]
MNRSSISNLIGLLLLLACFAFALFKVFSRNRAEASGGEIIRFAHWQLEGGLRKALDQLARDYEKLHPGVKVEQLAIPERTYAQWIQTQLIGGTATDILQLGRLSAGEDEMLARFFQPLSDLVERPNPYNKGTELENTIWRETFVDGLTGGFAYRPNLLEYYGVGMSMFTVRVYYNVSLWKRILGDTPAPRNFNEFLDVCHRVETYAKEKKVDVIPVAGSKANGPQLIQKFVTSQTQKMARATLRNYSMKSEASDVGISYLRGDWTLDTPAITDAFTINREVGLLLQPGYMSITREDASFYFLQSHALMIATGSWDAPSFRQQADFDIKVFDIPIPSPSHPKYGRNVLGLPSEAATNVGLTFGINRDSKHRERAIDFLHFITSKAGNTKFTELSDWLPAVVGVTPPPFVVPFLPRTVGYVDGFEIPVIGGNTKRILDNANNTLVQPSGSVDAYKALLRPDLDGTVRQDLARLAHISRINIGRQDLILAACAELVDHSGKRIAAAKAAGADTASETAAGPKPAVSATADKAGLLVAEMRNDAILRQRLSQTLEAQNQQEGTRAWILGELARPAGR